MGAHDGRKAEEHTPVWLDEPEDHDFPAARDYLSLIADDAEVERIVDSLRAAPTVRAAAKDLLRASRLPLLPADNPHVAHDIAKVKDGRRLSPVLLVRGDIAADRPLQIADGYHRVCASHHLDEDTEVPARIVGM